MNLKQLRQSAADFKSEIGVIAKQLTTIGMGAVKAKRPMSDNEREQLVTLHARREELEEQLEANAVDLTAAEAANTAEKSYGLQPVPDPDAQAQQQAIARAGLRGGSGFTSEPIARQGARGKTYGELFGSHSLTTDGFASAEEFFRVLHSGRSDSRLHSAYEPSSMRASTGTGGVPSDGGFSVPTQFFSGIWNSALESQIVLPRASVVPMMSSELKCPAWDDSNHSANLFGGFAASWIGETVAPDPQLPKMRLVMLRARKLALFCQVSNELIADGMGFEQQLSVAISNALSFFLDQSFFNGDGSNKPSGILRSGATISVTRTTANRVFYEDITAMFARLHPASFPTATWVVSQSTLPDLLTLSLAVGTGGTAIPLVKEAGGHYSMLGLPIIITEKVPALGTAGDVGLYDFSQYLIGLRAGFALERSTHLGFQSDTSWYRGIIRVDGMSKINAPVTLANGAATVSPFVVLS